MWKRLSDLDRRIKQLQCSLKPKPDPEQGPNPQFCEGRGRRGRCRGKVGSLWSLAAGIQGSSRLRDMKDQVRPQVPTETLPQVTPEIQLRELRLAAALHNGLRV